MLHLEQLRYQALITVPKRNQMLNQFNVCCLSFFTSDYLRTDGTKLMGKLFFKPIFIIFEYLLRGHFLSTKNLKFPKKKLFKFV